MTLIAAIADGTNVNMVADSCAAAGEYSNITNNSKLFTKNGMLIGYTDSFRMGQLLEFFDFDPAKFEKLPYQYDDPYRLLVAGFIPEWILRLERNRWLSNENGEARGGAFLVGYKGRLFEVGSDFAVIEPHNGIAAIGSGCAEAYGSLYTTIGDQRRSAHYRLKIAFEASEYYTSTVRGPCYFAQV